MDVLMTPDAFFRRRLKRNLPEFGFAIRGLRAVAIHAVQHPVPAQQRERGGAVIEGLQLAPRAHFMTAFAHALPLLHAC